MIRCSSSPASGASGRATTARRRCPISAFTGSTPSSPPIRTVKPVYQKAMPVVLTTPAEVDQYLQAPIEEALTLLKPTAEDLLELASDEKKA